MIMSFGYKHGGPPRGAHLVYDVRHLDNPHSDPELRDLDGTDPRVVEVVLASRGAESAVRSIVAQVRRQAGEPILVAIGCTGGRHRSVVVATLVGQLLGEVVEHRDLLKRAATSGARTIPIGGSDGRVGPKRPAI